MPVRASKEEERQRGGRHKDTQRDIADIDRDAECKETVTETET
jgi:hypothetical protein